MHRSNTNPPCSPSKILTNPLCSPLTLFLFTTYIAFILTALYTIVRGLRDWHRQHQYEREIENEAYERLLRQLVEADSNFDEARLDHQRGATLTNGSSDSGGTFREDMGDAIDDSGGEGCIIKRTKVQRKAKNAEYEVPLIGSAKQGTIAKRRNERT